MLQAAKGNNDGRHDDEKQDADLQDGEHIVQPDAKPPGKGMNETCENGDADRDATYSTVTRILDVCSVQDAPSEADAVSRHISECYEGDCEDARTHEDRVLPVCGFAVHVL
jgi:hypothetical protein